MNITQDEIAAILESLANTPRRLQSLGRAHGATAFDYKPDADTWSANEILAHLRACADIWGKSILAMITQDHPTVRYVSPRTWMKKTNYATLTFSESLNAFQQQRDELVSLLTGLSPTDWLRGATFTATTIGREQTIWSYARRIADHEAVHLGEIGARLSWSHQ
jgi:hypothetical protein